jgi:hypothetical protein
MMTRFVTRFLPRDALLTAQARIEGAGLFPLFASLPAIRTQINYITYSCTPTIFKNVDLDPYEIFSPCGSHLTERLHPLAEILTSVSCRGDNDLNSEYFLYHLQASPGKRKVETRGLSMKTSMSPQSYMPLHHDVQDAMRIRLQHYSQLCTTEPPTISTFLSGEATNFLSLSWIRFANSSVATC